MTTIPDTENQDLATRSKPKTAPNHRRVMRVRLAELCQRAADALAALGDVAPALRSIAALLGEGANDNRRGVRRPRAAPAPYREPTVEFTELDSERARAALRRAGVLSGKGQS